MAKSEEEDRRLNASPCQYPSDRSTKKRLRCIVKLGGTAITCKHEIEKINEQNLEAVSSQLRQAMMGDSLTEKVHGMDWSRKHGMSEVAVAEDFEDSTSLQLDSFVIVHGAGSFGHFQASKSGVHRGGLHLPLVKAGFVATRISVLSGTFKASKSGVHRGGLHLPLVKAGFVATRISVTSLNLEIVRALARGERYPFGKRRDPNSRNVAICLWMVASADLSQLKEVLDAGFVPVLHGDAVFDKFQDCTILSGDVIIRHLAELLEPDYVVFLTDVLVVYDRLPTDPDAVLLREIGVDGDGSWSVVKPALHVNKQVEITVASHDTTGGMEGKILEAAMIAKLGIDVYITKAGTPHSLRALRGEIRGNIPDDWLGTAIQSSQRTNLPSRTE